MGLRPTPDEKCTDSWAALLAGDPRAWLLQSAEPAARWLALTSLFDRSAGDAEVLEAHRAVLADVGTRQLLARLPDWEAAQAIGGHHSPGFAPNLLILLHTMGLRAGEDERIERLLDAMLDHQDEHGRFATCGMWRKMEGPVWSALLCDHHAILEALVRFGRGEDERLAVGLRRMGDDLAETAQGRAWPCIADPLTGFRGPGRKGDLCPQVTLQALRAYALLPDERRPPWLLDVAAVVLSLWRRRGEAKPYMFGHGIHFKTVKWPTSWYNVHMVLDALGRYPQLQRADAAEGAHRRALAELAACLVAYNLGSDGRVTPWACYKGFEKFSFGQKKTPSAFATAQLCSVLRPFDELTSDIASVDVLRLGSSKGGSATALPPRR